MDYGKVNCFRGSHDVIGSAVERKIYSDISTQKLNHGHTPLCSLYQDSVQYKCLLPLTWLMLGQYGRIHLSFIKTQITKNMRKYIIQNT